MNRLRQCSRRRAFTLIEIMVVVLIIGALAALVGPSVMRQYEKSKISNTRTQIVLLSNAVKDYYLDVSEYPQSLDDLLKNPGAKKWNGPYLEKEKLPLDPWNEPFDYTYDKDKKQIRIFSKGPDKTTGTDDDIKGWE